MSDKALAAWGWTRRKATEAARTTHGAARSVVHRASNKAGPAAKAVAWNGKDITGVAAGTLAVKAAFVPVLNGFGLSAAGPVAGSWAAFAMSLHGGAVPAGGLYATLQSIAMGGTAVGLAMPLSVAGGSYLTWKGVQRSLSSSKEEPKHPELPSDHQ